MQTSRGDLVADKTCCAIAAAKVKAGKKELDIEFKPLPQEWKGSDA